MTYANSTPATDGRIVVAWFGSQGVHAYDVNGAFSGRLTWAASTSALTTFQPSNGAASPHHLNGLVILQCDTKRIHSCWLWMLRPARQYGKLIVELL